MTHLRFEVRGSEGFHSPRKKVNLVVGRKAKLVSLSSNFIFFFFLSVNGFEEFKVEGVVVVVA